MTPRLKRFIKLLWLGVHHPASAAVQLGLQRRRTAGARRTTSTDQVSFLLLHAYGMGGAVRAVFNLAGDLSSDREVHLVSVLRRSDEPAFPLPPVQAVLVLDDRRPGAVRSPLQRALSLVPSVLVHPLDSAWVDFTLYTDLQMLRWFRSTRSGVIVTTRPGLNLFGARHARHQTPVIGQEHIALSSYPSALRREVRRQYPRLDALTPLTARDLRQYEQLLGAGRPVLVRIPNSVTPLPGEPQADREHVVVGAGRLRPAKGFDLLVRAFAPVAHAHPDWRLVIHGEGAERPALQELVAALGLREVVSLPGAHRSLGEPLARAAVFVLSSRLEGFPMVLLEAMSKGTAIVAFDCETGPAEILTHGRDGLLVPAEDVAALTRELLGLVEDESRRSALGRAAVATSERYSLAATGATWRELLASFSAPDDPAAAPPPPSSSSHDPGRPTRPL